MLWLCMAWLLLSMPKQVRISDVVTVTAGPHQGNKTQAETQFLPPLRISVIVIIDIKWRCHGITISVCLSLSADV